MPRQAAGCRLQFAMQRCVHAGCELELPPSACAGGGRTRETPRESQCRSTSTLSGFSSDAPVSCEPGVSGRAPALRRSPLAPATEAATACSGPGRSPSPNVAPGRRSVQPPCQRTPAEAVVCGTCRFFRRAEARLPIRLPPTPCEVGDAALRGAQTFPSEGCCPRAAGRRHRTRQYDVALSSRASTRRSEASGCPFACRSGSASRGFPRSANANVREPTELRKPK